jgi:Carboxypeptidase regulatory-like domain/Putative binding domain, N-terminal
MTRSALSGGIMALVAGMSLMTACGTTSPSQPTPSARPNISISSISVGAEALSSGGYAYRVTVKLRESGGVGAAISSVELAFMRDAVTLASLREERPISDTVNEVPANATVDSREMALADSDLSHPAATSVVAKVSFTDGAAGTNSATGSADIPAPEPALYTLSGRVSDENSGRMLLGGTVEIVDGPNAGRTSATDAAGIYSLSDLAGGSFVVRATSHGYDPREQSVMVARDTTLDLRLRPIPAAPPRAPSPTPPSSPSACTYAVSPSETGIDYHGGNRTVTISRTSGTCSWNASSDAGWITFPGGASGSGSGTLAYTVAPNGTFSARSGRVTVSWAAGSTQVRVQQGNHPDWECFVSIGGGQGLNNVPSAGAQFTVSATVLVVPPVWNGIANCSAQVTASVPWISGGGSVASGTPATFTFTVAPNPSPGTARSGSIVAASFSHTQALAVTQR